jgi:hypothetical protein
MHQPKGLEVQQLLFITSKWQVSFLLIVLTEALAMPP